MSKDTLPPATVVKLADHKIKWQNCQRCGLCANASNHVFFRRLNRLQNAAVNERFIKHKTPKIQCSIVMLGEAPGEVEDAEGLPFVGPSGQLLNRVVSDALKLSGMNELRWIVGFTNVVACIPSIPDGGGVRPPSSPEAKQCQPRLEEFLVSAKPKLIVCVGTTAKMLFPRGIGRAQKTFPSLVSPVAHIIHPAAILRMKESSQATEEARIRVELVRLFQAIKGAK